MKHVESVSSLCLSFEEDKSTCFGAANFACGCFVRLVDPPSGVALKFYFADSLVMGLVRRDKFSVYCSAGRFSSIFPGHPAVQTVVAVVPLSKPSIAVP